MGTIVTNNKIIIKRGDSVSPLLNFRCGVSEMDDFIHDRENGLQKMMQLNFINVWFVYLSDELIGVSPKTQLQVYPLKHIIS